MILAGNPCDAKSYELSIKRVIWKILRLRIHWIEGSQQLKPIRQWETMRLSSLSCDQSIELKTNLKVYCRKSKFEVKSNEYNRRECD